MLFKGRYSVLFAFLAFFLLVSLLVRSGLVIASLQHTSFSFPALLRIYGLGLLYDLAAGLFLTAIYNLYLLLLPSRWNNTPGDRLFTYCWLFLMLLISFFSAFAELTFWQEFESRFNFIAVDYLIYTYEVIHNINESYPLPLLTGGILGLVLLAMFLFRNLQLFRLTFKGQMPFSKRMLISGSLFACTLIFALMLDNSAAEKGNNHYQNELSKAGIFSFFAAFRNNELNYNDFYTSLNRDTAFRLIRQAIAEPGSSYLQGGHTIRRKITAAGPVFKPNVIMITVESLSASFMGQFGNRQHLTPVLDSLAKKSVCFTSMYATGTRTVRGMEALTLCAPPTPGNSIVRRQGNEKLATTGYTFSRQGYHTEFYYGGDGYFDNMDEYFSSNGFDITDRGRKIIPGSSYPTRRTGIKDNQVHFENAWGICDEDLFDAVLRGSDAAYASGRPFYNFVMTTSNHRPYTFPDGKIPQLSGSGRGAAVRYTDYAIGEFLKKLSHKAWCKNTVVIIVADHCASSAGKNEIDISKYHIPCMLLNLPGQPARQITQLCSQIDLYPTLFGLLGWNYESKLFGKNVLAAGYRPRALMGTYQKLAYLEKDSLVILSPQRRAETFLYKAAGNIQVPVNADRKLTANAIATYQTAYDLFKNGGMHQ